MTLLLTPLLCPLDGIRPIPTLIEFLFRSFFRKRICGNHVSRKDFLDGKLFCERSETLTEGNFLTLFGVPLAIIVLAVISYFLVGKEDSDDESYDEKGLS